MTPRPLNAPTDERHRPEGASQADAQSRSQTDALPPASRGAARSVELTGGESVYCINESQLKSALRLAEQEGESGRRIQQALADVERDLSRNERAALAFLLIERLRAGG